MLRDMMPLFDLYQPDTLDNALDLADRLGPEGWLVAGGQDSWDWLKNRTRRTRAVVDLHRRTEGRARDRWRHPDRRAHDADRRAGRSA